MRKTIVFFALAALACLVQAQPAILKGKENKNMSVESLSDGRYLGQYGKLDCWIYEGRKHYKQLAMVNIDLEEQYKAELPGSQECQVLAASMDKQYAGVLVANKEKRNCTVLGRYKVALDSVKTVGGQMDTLIRFDYGKKDECLTWGAVSPSGNYMALIAVVRYVDELRYRTYIALFDAAGNKQWTREFALGSLNQITVTDDGRVVTLGVEPDEEGQCFVVNLVSEKNSRSNRIFVQCDPLRDLKMVTVNGSYLLAVGSFGPSGKKFDQITLGTLSFSFNLDSAVLSGFNLLPFSNEDINIFYNKSTKKIQTQLFCESLGLVDASSTPYGCAALFGRKMRIEYTSSTGARQTDYQIVGLHCVAIDTLGDVKWVRNLRCNDLQEGSDGIVGASMLMANGKLSIIKSEHKKMPATYDISKPVSQFTIGDKANTVMYSFDENGNVQKLLVEKASKQNILRTLLRHDGSLLMLGSNGSKQRAAELKFVY